jgi:eukaryotic-like serine/threonine-protein kinase
VHTTEQLNSALIGRYRIERRIGAGGMATVYLARDMKHDRDVALKVLNPELGAVLGVDRFLSEIRVTANLQHPNLLPLFDSGEADGLLFYVMPYVAGESLRAKLDREKQLPIDEAIRIAVGIANALDYAHRQGVIHRDLKPENILLQEGQPLIADFGIALAVSNAGGARVTQTGLSLGTPQYMSPEQATGDRTIDGRSDIYSLGAALYEMLTGEAPHTGTTAQAIIARVLTERPRAVHVARPNVPAYLEVAIDRALEKLPADRFATATEFAAALQSRHASTEARHTTPVIAARSTNRLRTIAMMTTIGIVGVGVGIAIDRSSLFSAAALPTEFSGDLIGGPAIAFNPRVSPDGKTVAFVALIDGTSQLAVLTPSTGSWLLLTRDRSRGQIDDIAWSADGAKLYFDRLTDVQSGIYSIPAIGGEERLVVEKALSPQALADGSILFRRTNDQGQTQIFRHWPSSGRMDALPAASAPGFLGTFFRALPNQQAVVFYGKPLSDSLRANHLYIIDLESKRVRPIATGLSIKPPHWRFPLAVSPDGKHVLFDLMAHDLHRIVAVPTDGTQGLQTLITLTSGALGIDMGSDGSLYVDQGSQPTQILWYSPETGRTERLTVPNGAAAALALSDGRVLMPAHAGGVRVLMMALGREIRPFVDTPEETRGPLAQVGPNHVALVLGTAPKRQLVLASRTTGQIVGRIDAIDAERVEQLAATPDGKTMLYTADKYVWAIATAGGPARRIRRGDAVAVHPDGTYLVIQINEQDAVRLVRVSWPDGAESEIPIKGGPVRVRSAPLSPNAIARDGRITLRVGVSTSWYDPAGILDPRTGAISMIGAANEDMLTAGWSTDGRVVARANATFASLWRFTPLR